MVVACDALTHILLLWRSEARTASLPVSTARRAGLTLANSDEEDTLLRRCACTVDHCGWVSTLCD